MGKSQIVGISIAVIIFTVLFGWLRSHVNSIPGLHNANPVVVQVMVMLLGLVGLGLFGWFSMRKQRASKGDAPPESSQDVDDLVYEAETRLSEAQNQKDSKISKLPTVFLVGEAGSAKTSTMVNSGLDAELLSGQVYEESKLVETPTVNFWFARHTLFVEAAGKLLADTELWRKLTNALTPGKLASALGTAKEAPRAALVCVDAESLLTPDGELLNLAARNLRTRLSEISQLLGINLPVYVLFTRTDRIPFFAEYVKALSNEDAVKTVGSTLPIVESRKGVYSEEETTRLSGVFEKLFRALCNARPDFLSRESDATQLPGVYEFPREFRKLRVPLVRFLVELCRPSQLTVGPFLRGFYFSGVRPVVVNEVAPLLGQAQQENRGDLAGATGIFRQGAGQSAGSAGQRIVGTRKIPQWLFLGHLFSDVLLTDQAAKSASATHAKPNVPRRILLGAVAGLCLLYSGLLAMSFSGNRALETKADQAARGIVAVEPGPAKAASLDSLQRLETLRQTLLDDCQHSPLSHHFGLYVGDTVCPEVRRLYYFNFSRLLLVPTQEVMLDFLRGLPATPGPAFDPTYSTLKAYLITTSNHDRTDSTLSPTLLDRWSANRNIEKERRELAKQHFDFYANQLKQDKTVEGNDAPAVEKARVYLANNFENIDVKYQQLLASAAKTGSPVRFEDSAHTVTDPHEVPAAFTKEGWAHVRTALKDPAQYDKSDWVLGDKKFTKTSASGAEQSMAALLGSRYSADFVKQWIAYLRAANVSKYSNLGDAAGKLETLSGNSSPIVGLLWLAAKHTAVDKPEVANIFLPVQTVVSSAGGPTVAAPNDAYIDKLSGLKRSVKTLADQPQGDIKDVLQNASDAEEAVKKVTRYHADTTGDTASQTDAGKDVDRFLRQPILYAESLVKTLGPGELNAKGKGLCGPFRAMAAKFPFNSNTNAAQASIAEVNGIFKKPDGALWKLYNENLQKLLPLQGTQYVPAPGPATLNPAFVSFFNRAAAISEFLYAGGAQNPHFNYTVKVAQLDRMPGATLDLQIDGQQLSSSGGPAPAKAFVWQADANHEVKATAKLGQVSLSWGSERSSRGLWSLFAFLAEGKQPTTANPNWYGWNVGITGSRGNSKLIDETAPAIWLEVDMGGAPHILQRGSLALPGCVAEVAK